MSVLFEAKLFRRIMHAVITKPWSVAAGPLTLGMLQEKYGKHQSCGKAVNMCSQVRLRELDGAGHYTYSMVTPDENDPSRGRLSCCSPLGFALLGKQPGEQVTVRTLFRNLRFEVDKVKCCRSTEGARA